MPDSGFRHALWRTAPQGICGPRFISTDIFNDELLRFISNITLLTWPCNRKIQVVSSSRLRGSGDCGEITMNATDFYLKTEVQPEKPFAGRLPGSYRGDIPAPYAVESRPSKKIRQMPKKLLTLKFIII
jgi:hypothetical protein